MASAVSADERISREFRLAAAGARWPRSPEADAAMHELAGRGTEAGVDWDRVLRIVIRQRIAGIFHRSCKLAGIVLPEDFNRSLAQTSAAQARASLGFAVESLRLQAVFREAGVSVLFLKGVSLTMLAYGDLGLRQAKDIDLLIPEDALEQASSVLIRAGYRRRLPAEDVSAEKYLLWLRYARNMEWWDPRSGAEVELHWALTGLKGDLHAESSRQSVAILPGACLDTLSYDPLFAYLCLHGASHGWSRLKWLADVYALLMLHPVEDLGDFYEKIARLGAGRSAGQALLLCEQIFELRLPASLSAKLHRSLRLRVLNAVALRAMLSGDGEREIYDVPFGTTTVHLSRFLVAGDSRLVLQEARHVAFPADLLMTSRLPHGYVFLFPAVRAVDWARKHLRLFGQ